MIRTHASSHVKLISVAVNSSYSLKRLHLPTFYAALDEGKQIAPTQTAVLKDAATRSKSFT